MSPVSCMILRDFHILPLLVILLFGITTSKLNLRMHNLGSTFFEIVSCICSWVKDVWFYYRKQDLEEDLCFFGAFFGSSSHIFHHQRLQTKLLDHLQKGFD